MPGLERNIKVMLVYKACGGLFFFVPVLTLFWQENGLSLFEVMLLQSIFSIATVCLEVPSGMAADRFGRRRILILASAAALAGLVIYSQAQGFYSFLAGELLLAVWIAFMSGADSALLYDTLADLGREAEYPRIWGRIQLYSLALLGAANVLGGLLGVYGLRLTVLASLPFSLLALVSACFFVDAGRRSRASSARAQLREVVQLLAGQWPLLGLIGYGGLVFAFNQAGLWIYQPYFQAAGVEVAYFGVLFAAFQLTAGLVGHYTWWLIAKVGEARLLAALIVATGLASLALGVHLALYSFVLVFVHQFVRGLYHVLLSGQINRLAASEARASILSVQSLVGRLIYALLIPLIGWVADVYSVQQAFLMLGVTALACSVPALLVLRAAGVFRLASPP